MSERTLTPRDDEWPAYLNEVGSLQPIERLFAQGQRLRGGRGMVAIVGARRPTVAGIEMATHFATGLAEAGYGIVSGLAVGIDAAAHRAALDAGGYTVAVLGCGLDVAYPRANARLRRDIVERGTVVTEYEWGVGPMTFQFPARNRVIAALSEAVLFVEGTLKSGGRITVDHALEANRMTFAVPGSARNPLAAGPNETIRRAQATLVTDVDHLLEELAPGTLFDADPDPVTRQPPKLSDDEQRVLMLLDDAPVTPERLGSLLDMTSGSLSLALARLEAAGYLRRSFRGAVITAAGARVRSVLVTAEELERAASRTID